MRNLFRVLDDTLPCPLRDEKEDTNNAAVQGVWATCTDSVHQCVSELGPAPTQDSPDGCQPRYLANLASWSSGNTEEVKY